MTYVGYPFRLTFSVGLLSADDTVILTIRTPDGASSLSFPATVSDLASGTCYVDFTASDITQFGWYTGYPVITRSDGSQIPCSSLSFEVGQKEVYDHPFSEPSPDDVRGLLEGYGTDLSSSLILGGSWAEGSNLLTGCNASVVKRGDRVFGTGIPDGARVSKVLNPSATAGEIAIDRVTTAAGTAATALQYLVVSDGWIMDRRDKFVVPWIERITRMSFRGIRTVTEYYDGTGSSMLILRRRPIVELLAISYTNVDSNLYYLTPSAIQVIAEEGLLKAKANFNESTYIPIFYRGDRNVRVTYKCGAVDYPQDVAEAVTAFLAEQVLAHAASKTGGGSSVSGQGYTKSFGDGGKWANRRNELAREGMSLLRKYMTGAQG